MQLLNQSQSPQAINGSKINQHLFRDVIPYESFTLFMGFGVVLGQKAKSILSVRQINSQQYSWQSNTQVTTYPSRENKP